MSKILHIRTPAGRVYDVSTKGELAVTGVPYSGDWLFLGLKHVRYNRVIHVDEITEDFIDNVQLRYKNGNPKYTVLDRDHGTVRMWGNTKYNGVSSLWYE